MTIEELDKWLKENDEVCAHLRWHPQIGWKVLILYVAHLIHDKPRIAEELSDAIDLAMEDFQKRSLPDWKIKI